VHRGDIDDAPIASLAHVRERRWIIEKTREDKLTQAHFTEESK
jgi:hypothetical protein